MYQFNNSSVIYVAQGTGDDQKYNGLAPTAGSFGSGPFKTLNRALEAVKDLRTANNFRNITIALTEDYFIVEPLVFSPGTGGVTLESFGDRKKIIGGISVTGWKKDVFNGIECFSAKLPAKSDGSCWDFTDFYVNGKRALITRYPKEGSLEALDTENNVEDTPNIKTSSKWFIAKKEDLNNIDKIEDSIVNYYHFWVDAHTPVESYNVETGKLTMEYISRYMINTRYGIKHPGEFKYYLTNVPSMFSSSNEWYLDRKTGTVYYIPENPNIKPEEIVAYAPVTSALIKINENDVIIRNLELTCTRGEYKSQMRRNDEKGIYEFTNEVTYASDIQSICWGHGAIIFENSKRSGIYNCYIHGIGVYAIEIKTGCKNIRVEDNNIYDIGAGGVKVFGGMHGCEPSFKTQDCVIKGNTISYCGKRYAAGCGVLVCHAANNEISQNEIHHLDYSGISVGWVWGYKDSSTYGNIIRKNYVHHIGLGKLSDMGGIYLLGKQKGTLVSENRIHDVNSANYGGHGIYADEGSSYLTIENNVVYNTQSDCFVQHYGTYNTVRNNIFAFGSSCASLSRYELHDSVLFENNIFVVNGGPVYGGDNTMYTQSKNNIIYDISGRNNPIMLRKNNKEEYDLNTWQEKMGKDIGSIVLDPEFINIAEYDFTLRPNSTLKATGFKPITGFPAKNPLK